MNIFLFGCGALGSQIAMHLACQDNKFYLYDDDVVDLNNVNTRTSAFSHMHINASKVHVLAEMLWQKGHSIAFPFRTTVTDRNINRLLENFDENSVILDCFDNMESRSLFLNFTSPVLHIGVSAQRTGAVMWNDNFTLPLPGTSETRGENPVCTNQLGAPILRLTSDVATRVLEIYLETRNKLNYWITESLQITQLRV